MHGCTDLPGFGRCDIQLEDRIGTGNFPLMTSLNFNRWSRLSRPLAASVVDHYRSLGSFRATEATTTTNIDVHYMQPALQPKSLGAVSLMVAV